MLFLRFYAALFSYDDNIQKTERGLFFYLSRLLVMGTLNSMILKMQYIFMFSRMSIILRIVAFSIFMETMRLFSITLINIRYAGSKSCCARIRIILKRKFVMQIIK